MNYLKNMTDRYPALAVCEREVARAAEAVVECYNRGGKILLLGNGGSAADAEHISGELLKGFLSKRPVTIEERERLSPLGDAADKLQRGIPAIPLTSLSSLLSAYANDVDPELVYAQLVFALGRECDLAFGLSTSGNSKNVVAALKTAKALGIKTVAMTGETGGELADIADIVIKAPACETYKVQEYHLPIYHAICAEAERIIFEEN